jgi:hypothetical protein
MTTRRSGGLLFCLLVGLSACSQVLRLDEFEDAEVPGAGGASSASTATSGTTSATTAGAGGGTGGDGGSGGESACRAGDTVACYEGPVGTADIGMCKSGVQTCFPDGTGFGACEGQVLPSPQPESCSSPSDQDCIANCEEYQWAYLVGGGAGAQAFANSVGVDGAGNTFGVVSMLAPVTLDGQTYTPQTPYYDRLVVKVDPKGVIVWAKVLSTSDWLAADQPSNLHVTQGGEIVLVGLVAGSLLFDGQTILTNPSGGAGFVAKIGEDGAPIWGVSLGDDNSDFPTAVTALDSGEVLVAGGFVGTFPWGASSKTSKGDVDGFLGKLDASGARVWLETFGDTGADYVTALTVDSAGNAYAGGGFTGTLDFGGFAVTSVGGQDGFVSKWTSQGALFWLDRLGGAGNYDGVSALAVTDLGEVLVAGACALPADFAGMAIVGDQATSSFLGNLAPNGIPQSQRSFSALVGMMDRAPSGELLLSGTGVSIDFGLGPVPGPSFAVQLDAQGTAQWNRSFEQTPLVVFAPGRAITLAGALDTTIDLGGPVPLENLGVQSGFLAKIGRPGL